MKKTLTFIFVLLSGIIFMRCTQSDQFVIDGCVENENMSGKKVFITISTTTDKKLTTVQLSLQMELFLLQEVWKVPVWPSLALSTKKKNLLQSSIFFLKTAKYL